MVIENLGLLGNYAIWCNQDLALIDYLVIIKLIIIWYQNPDFSKYFFFVFLWNYIHIVLQLDQICGLDSKVVYLRNEFDFWKVHGIMNTSVSCEVIEALWASR